MDKILSMKVIFLLMLVANLSFANDMVWSKTGHRVVGEVAEHYLSKKAKRAIDALLDGKSLAAVSTFGDEIKADRTYAEFSAWHYVNMPADKSYSETEPSANGDLVMGIDKCIAVIKDRNSTRDDKVFYLKFLVHLIGDLHQPMHVGRAEDKGGNDIQLQWFNEGTNLHRVWDSNMINDYDMSFTELASELPELSKKEVKVLQSGTLLDWVAETQVLANTIYDSVETGEKLRYQYSYDWWGTVEDQLQKGGIRLAAVLNDTFE